MNGTMMEVSIRNHRNIEEEHITRRGLKGAIEVKWRIEIELGDFEGEATEFIH